MQIQALPNNLDEKAMKFPEVPHSPIRHLDALVFLQKTNIGWQWISERCSRQGFLTEHGWIAREMHCVASSVDLPQKAVPDAVCSPPAIPQLTPAGFEMLAYTTYASRICVIKLTYKVSRCLGIHLIH